MQAISRLFTVLFVLSAMTACLAACAPGSGAPAAVATAARSSPVPAATPYATPPFVQIEQSDMPPMVTTLAGLSQGLDAARANGTWVSIYPPAMDALSLQESGLSRDKPNAGAYRLAADVAGRIDIVNSYTGKGVEWRMLTLVTRPFAIDPNHSYAGNESINILPGRYLERTSDQRLLEIEATQLQRGNRVDLWIKDNRSPSNYDITVVLVDAP